MGMHLHSDSASLSELVRVAETRRARFLGTTYRIDAFNVIAGVVLYEVIERLMRMCGPGASTCPSEEGQKFVRRLTILEVATGPQSCKVFAPLSLHRRPESSGTILG
jgi:hypothetical protein